MLLSGRLFFYRSPALANDLVFVRQSDDKRRLRG
jgi:hypothetical protein